MFRFGCARNGTSFKTTTTRYTCLFHAFIGRSFASLEFFIPAPTFLLSCQLQIRLGSVSPLPNVDPDLTLSFLITGQYDKFLHNFA
jgi:hypothetical protein